MSDLINKISGKELNAMQFYRPVEDVPHMTNHAIQRTAQRNISQQAILAALRYGKKLHRTGRVFFVLRKKDVAMEPELNSFTGTTIMLGRDGAIVTAYSNQKAHSMIKKKPKRSRNW